MKRIACFFGGTLFLGTTFFHSSASAELVITLQPKDTAGNPISTMVADGTDVVVDILLSVNGTDDPLLDLRLLQFDLSGTASTIEIGAFSWQFDSLVSSSSYVQFPGGLRPSAAYVGVAREEGLILDLSSAPVRVATLPFRVHRAGTLDVINRSQTDPSNTAEFSAGFDESREFTIANGNLSGGTLAFNGGGGTPPPPPPPPDLDGDGVLNNADPDDDGDGVNDSADVFPLDSGESVDSDSDGAGDNSDVFPNNPEETADSDEDGVGDVADAFPDNPDETADSDGDGIGNNEDQSGGQPRPRGPCGLGMLGSLYSCLAGWTLFFSRRRIIH